MDSSTQYKAVFSDALRSYNAMETTKRRHFDYMTMLESKKKKFNIDATESEMTVLASLLSDHNDEVQAFKSYCDALKTENSAAHQAFFDYLAEINSAMAPIQQSTGH